MRSSLLDNGIASVFPIFPSRKENYTLVGFKDQILSSNLASVLHKY